MKGGDRKWLTVVDVLLAVDVALAAVALTVVAVVLLYRVVAAFVPLP